MNAGKVTLAGTHKRMAGKLANALRSLADALSPPPVQDTEVSCTLSLRISLRGDDALAVGRQGRSEAASSAHYQIGLGLSAMLEEEARRDFLVPIRDVAGVDTLGIRVVWTPAHVQHHPAGTQLRTI